MAKAHIEVSNADELVAAVAQTQSLQIKQAQQDFYRGIQVYGERYPVYSRWMRVFFAQSVVCLIGFIAEGAIALSTVNDAPDTATTAAVYTAVWIVVGLATYVAGLVMRHKRDSIPRPKRR